MTDSAGPAPDRRRGRWRRFRTVLATLLRALGSAIVMLAIYYLLPLDQTSPELIIVMLAAGLLLFVALVALQVRSIVKSTHPALKAVGALATSVPFFLLLFAATYFLMAAISSANFNQPLSRTDSLYFTVTVFATVGFGDIVPTSEPARALVTGQMVAGLVIVGLGARIIVDAIQHGREQQPLLEQNAAADGESGPE